MKNERRRTGARGANANRRAGDLSTVQGPDQTGGVENAFRTDCARRRVDSLSPVVGAGLSRDSFSIAA